MTRPDVGGQIRVMSTRPLSLISFSSTLSLAACTLTPAALDGEAGDELGESDASESDESDASESDASETSGDPAEQLPECIAGTTIEGSSVAPLEYRFEGDLIACATGLGHTTQPLAIDWTIAGPQATAAIHEVGDEVRLLDQSPLTVTRIDQQGNVLASFAAPIGAAHFLTSSAVDDEGRILLALGALEDGDSNVLALLDPTWTSVAWSVDVGSDAIGPIVRSGDDFLVGRETGSSAQVVRVTASGDLLDVIPIADQQFIDMLAATPSGFLVDIQAGLRAYDAAGVLAWEWSSTEYSIQALASAGEAAIVVGSVDGGGEEWIARIDEGELTWSSRYRRAEVWHPLGEPEQPRDQQDLLFLLGTLDDGTFVTGGPQFVSNDDFGLIQPFIVHFDAEGHTLAQDRVFGELTPYMLGGGSAAYVWMSGESAPALLRRYQP